MARAETYIGPIRGRVGNIIFRQLPGGEVIISAAPRKTKKLPTRAQVRQRAKMLNALNFAKQNGNLLKIVNGFEVPTNEFIAWQHNTARPAWYRSILPTVYPPFIAPSVHALQVSQSGITYNLANEMFVAAKQWSEIGSMSSFRETLINASTGLIKSGTTTYERQYVLYVCAEKILKGSTIKWKGTTYGRTSITFAMTEDDPLTWESPIGQYVEVVRNIGYTNPFNFEIQWPKTAYLVYALQVNTFDRMTKLLYQPTELLRSSSIVRVGTDSAMIYDDSQLAEPLQFEEVDTLPLTTDKDFIVITPEDGIYSTPFSRLNVSMVDDDIILDSWPQRRPQSNFLTPDRING